MQAANGASSGAIVSTPLAERAPPQSTTMFTRLDPSKTGAHSENSYDEPRMWGDRYQEFLFGAVGTGVAVGDYDADGLPDIFVVSKVESCRLFRNLGGMRFEDVTESAGVGDKGPDARVWKQGATFTDVNNDGLLDLYLCRFDSPNRLYVNRGDGTFDERAREWGLDIRDGSAMAHFCDYDRDGWLDAYVATNILDAVAHPNGNPGHLLRNTGAGRFENVTTVAGITGAGQTHSAAWWDYDGDGWPDLYVANDYGAPDKLYRNNRDPAAAGFTDTIATALPYTSYSSMGSDTGDVNNDGLIDFIVGDMAATKYAKEHRRSVDLRDRDTDPPEPLLTAPKYRRNALLLNTGTGRMLEAAQMAGIAATGWTWSLRFADFDNDGLLDLHVSNGMLRDQDLDVNARMMTAESAAERIRLMRDSPPLPEKNIVFRNLGDLEFADESRAWGLDDQGITFGVALGDLDRDGDMDIASVSVGDGLVIHRNDSQSGNRIVVALNGTVSNRLGIGATVTVQGDGWIQTAQLWPARGYLSSSEPVLHFGLGARDRVTRMTVTWPSGQEQVFENLPANNRFTITEPAFAPSELHRGKPAFAPSELQRGKPTSTTSIFSDVSTEANFSHRSQALQFDELSQEPLLPFRFSRRGPAIAVADINGDGREDALIGATTVTPGKILLGSESGRFIAAAEPLPGQGMFTDDGPLLVFDANRDGHPDLLVTKTGNSIPAGAPGYRPALFLNDGNGGFRAAPDGVLPRLSISAGAAASADFDRDGNPDVFLGARLHPGEYPSAPASVLLANRGGRFEDVTDAVAPGLRKVGLVSAATWSDVDLDGWPDLVCALEWGSVTVFRNAGGTRLEDATASLGFAAAGSGWWCSIAQGDFNADGRPDFVVGNNGLNTPYHASPAHPVLLFHGDFRGDPAAPGLQQLEAVDEDGVLIPRRSRRLIGSAIPAVRRKFSSDASFGASSIEAIVGTEALASAKRYAATEFRSGIFLSKPNGTFEFRALPRVAQIAPASSVATGDFNADGKADIALLHNSHAPVPAAGRIAGGLGVILLGDGAGTFTALPAAQSGFAVPGDAKSLAVVDLNSDGMPDLLATIANGESRAFRNQVGQDR